MNSFICCNCRMLNRLIFRARSLKLLLDKLFHLIVLIGLFFTLTTSTNIEVHSHKKVNALLLITSDFISIYIGEGLEENISVSQRKT